VLYKAPVRSLVRKYVAESARLARHHGNNDDFGQEQIALSLFRETKTSKNRLSRKLSSSSDEPLTKSFASELLTECRARLTLQLSKLRLSQPEEAAAAFERSACESLGIAWQGSVDFDSLLIRREAGSDSSPADELPDLLIWHDGAFDFASRLEIVLDRSMDVLRELLIGVDLAATRQKRLDISRMAASIACLNHPGSRHHQRAWDTAMQIATKANLWHLCHDLSVDVETRRAASEYLYYIYLARVSPTLDSPFNFAKTITNRRPISSSQLSIMSYDLDMMVVHADEVLRTDPANPWSYRIRSSAYSMKARVLLCTGHDSDFHEAERCHRLSLCDLDKIGYPYGYAYPVLRAALSQTYSQALDECDRAIAELSAGGSNSSASAFAALRVQLMHLQSPGSLPTGHILDMARAAIRDPSTCYQCSHIFDADFVRPLLLA